MTVLSEHLGYGLLEECAFANYPNNVLWVRRNDGILLGFTYYRDQDVTAWHRHTIAGTSSGCTITVTDYANIAAGKTLKFTKSDGSTVTFTSTTGTPGSNEFKTETNNNTTADNIYTTINGHSDFVVANPAANVVTVRETNPKGPMLKVLLLYLELMTLLILCI